MKAIDFINGLNESFSKIEEGSWIPSIKDENEKTIQESYFAKLKVYSLTNKQGFLLKSLLTKENNKIKSDGSFVVNNVKWTLIDPPHYIKTNGFFKLTKNI